ncbi:MAG: hypothetical protein K1X72_23410 [Pyrinomonadaceae bacterium]|nr:hypothetical protein [Pyrinomonadaceae bacterium]
MPTFYDSNGKPYALSIEIGRGGEGTVFYCPNDLSLVAKVYHEPVTEEKAEKLRWMAANKNEGLLKIAAWIVDTLHEQPNGKIVGFLMPNVKAKEIHELYSLKSRRVHFPEATWQFLIHTAANVARAFYVLHKNDHIMGDVNHGNCVVLADGTVKLIDCDSYSIKTDKIRYICDVGVATHLAPELQGIDLSEVTREKKHDNFGLAVIIFQLLFLGRHPFAGNYLGAEDKSLEDCIREHRFAYGNQSVTNVKQPPGTLSLTQISPRLAIMFTKAFMTENRPEAREWIEALDDLSKVLKQCTAHIGHFYFEELTACPWCGIESQTGLILFPFISNENGEKGFNIFTVESLLASLEVPRNLPAKPFKPKVLPPPSKEALDLQNTAKNRIASFVVLHFLLVLIWTVLGGAASGIALGIFLGFGFYFINQKLAKDTHEKLDLELNEARQHWIRLENDWKNNKDQNLLETDLGLIRGKIAQHQATQRERIELLANFKEEFFNENLRKYLSSYRLSDLSLDQKNLDALTRYGLQSAVDIEEKRLQPMLALDNSTKNYLIEWRKDLEKNFEFKPDSDLPEVAKNRFEIEWTEKRRKIEKDIEQLLAVVRLGSTTLRQKQEQIMAKAETFAQKLSQAESNFAVVGKDGQLAAALILITVLIPTFGSLFQSASSTKIESTAKSKTVVSAANAPSVANTAAKVVTNRPFDTNAYSEPDFKVNETITYKEIDEMSANDRLKSAKVLYNQSLPLIEQKDYKKAESKLSLAVKLVNYETRILYKYADVLYNLKKYNDSTIQLQELLKIDSGNETARLLLGANYMKLNKNDEAQNIFIKVLDGNPESFEALFNLAMVSQLTSDKVLADDYFQGAIALKPNDVEAHYQYGLYLCENNGVGAAKTQYKILLDLDKTKAEKLNKIIKTKPNQKEIKTVEVGKFEVNKPMPTPKTSPTPIDFK